MQVIVDQYNDKFPKFEEDDGSFTISAAGQQTGNRTNAGLPYYPAVWSTHLQSYAAASHRRTAKDSVIRLKLHGRSAICR